MEALYLIWAANLPWRGVTLLTDRVQSWKWEHCSTVLFNFPKHVSNCFSVYQLSNEKKTERLIPLGRTIKGDHVLLWLVSKFGVRMFALLHLSGKASEADNKNGPFLEKESHEISGAGLLPTFLCFRSKCSMCLWAQQGERLRRIFGVHCFCFISQPSMLRCWKTIWWVCQIASSPLLSWLNGEF